MMSVFYVIQKLTPTDNSAGPNTTTVEKETADRKIKESSHMVEPLPGIDAMISRNCLRLRLYYLISNNLFNQHMLFEIDETDVLR